MTVDLIFLIMGFLYIAMGFPLFLGKVKRNSLYGFRIEKTLSDDKYWFPVNKVSGMWFIISGAAIVFMDLLLNFSKINGMSRINIMIVTIIIGTILPIVLALKKLKQII